MGTSWGIDRASSSRKPLNSGDTYGSGGETNTTAYTQNSNASFQMRGSYEDIMVTRSVHVDEDRV